MCLFHAIYNLRFKIVTEIKCFKKPKRAIFFYTAEKIRLGREYYRTLKLKYLKKLFKNVYLHFVLF